MAWKRIVQMKKILLVVLFLCLSNNLSYSTEFYYTCAVKVEEDRSKKKFFKVGEVYGFQYFKIDTINSVITIHEQVGEEKPEIIGEKKIKVDYEINLTIENGNMVDTFNIIQTTSFENVFGELRLNGTTFVEDNFDYDFADDGCVSPFKNGKFLEGEKAKKVYQKWIKKGYGL